jgi:preprotein translocase subunit Sec61beta
MDTAILYVIGITVAVMVLIIDIMTGGLLLL